MSESLNPKLFTVFYRVWVLLVQKKKGILSSSHGASFGANVNVF